jgi:hypothetical protein
MHFLLHIVLFSKIAKAKSIGNFTSPKKNSFLSSVILYTVKLKQNCFVSNGNGKKYDWIIDYIYSQIIKALLFWNDRKHNITPVAELSKKAQVGFIILYYLVGVCLENSEVF